MADFNPAHRVIESHEIYSTHLAEERTIKVYLPPFYEPSKTYPVLYCHDGNEFFTHGRIATQANELIAQGRLNPLFIVGITVNMKHRDDDYGADGDRNGEYRQFVVQECLPFVEETYSIDPNLRFMAGISLGAVASLLLHIHYPEVFSRLLMFSGAFYESVQRRVQAVPKLSTLDAYMLVGRQETAVQTPHGSYDFYSYNQIMRDMLRLRHAKLAYHEADGTHIWGFWQKQIPQAMAWLQGHL